MAVSLPKLPAASVPSDTASTPFLLAFSSLLSFPSARFFRIRASASPNTLQKAARAMKKLAQVTGSQSVWSRLSLKQEIPSPPTQNRENRALRWNGFPLRL